MNKNDVPLYIMFQFIFLISVLVWRCPQLIHVRVKMTPVVQSAVMMLT